MEEKGSEMSHLSHVVLHDVATGRVLLPSVQFVYEGEEVPPHVLQRARLLVHLALADGAGEADRRRSVEGEPTTRVAQIDPTSAETRVQDFYVSSDEATGETLHIEGFFPFEMSEANTLSKNSLELLQELQHRNEFIRSLLSEAADEGLFQPQPRSKVEEDAYREPANSEPDAIDGFHDLDGSGRIPSNAQSPSPSSSSSFSALESSTQDFSPSHSTILSPQPYSKQQQLLDEASPSDVGSDSQHGFAENANDYDLARSEAEREHLKDIVLKFHRGRHALLSPQEEDEYAQYPISATTPNRSSAPSPYPYANSFYGTAAYTPYGRAEEVSPSNDPTMSPSLRFGQAPKVCLSPYKRSNLVNSGQHVYSTQTNSTFATPSRRALFNSGDALTSVPRDRSAPLSPDLGIIPPAASPPLPVQRELVDKVKGAFDEAMQSVKSKIIEEQLMTWAHPHGGPPRRQSPAHFDPHANRPASQLPRSPSMGQNDALDRYEEAPKAVDVLSGSNDRHALRASSDHQSLFFPRMASSPPPSSSTSTSRYY